MGFKGKHKGKRQHGKLGVNWRITLKETLKKGWYKVNWLYVAQGRDKRRAVVNTVINLRDP